MQFLELHLQTQDRLAAVTLGGFGNQRVCHQGRGVISLAIAVDQGEGLGLSPGFHRFDYIY